MCYIAQMCPNIKRHPDCKYMRGGWADIIILFFFFCLWKACCWVSVDLFIFLCLRNLCLQINLLVLRWVEHIILFLYIDSGFGTCFDMMLCLISLSWWQLLLKSIENSRIYCLHPQTEYWAPSFNSFSLCKNSNIFHILSHKLDYLGDLYCAHKHVPRYDL